MSQQSIFQQKTSENEESWISTSDMMAGLMIIFMFIAIAFINSLGTYIENTEEKICNELIQTFQDDIKDWKATVCENGVVIKFDDSVAFEKNRSDLKPEFKAILDDFFPRFMTVVWDNKEKVSELRIEGHTSSEFGSVQGDLDKYLRNATLSQDRSINVMDYSLNRPRVRGNDSWVDWMTEHVTSHGLSSSKKILVDDIEDSASSRRVEFRIETTAFQDIIEGLTGNAK